MSSGADVIDRLVLDTSAYSRLRQGDRAVVDLVAAAGTVMMPVTVIGELEAGFVAGKRTAENRAVLHEFLDEQFVVTLNTTRGVARRYGEIFGALKRVGTPIPTNDLWIAAATFDCGGRLLTFDDHFDRVSDLPRVFALPD